jgi:hypothetical protein
VSAQPQGSTEAKQPLQEQPSPASGGGGVGGGGGGGPPPLPTIVLYDMQKVDYGEEAKIYDNEAFRATVFNMCMARYPDDIDPEKLRALIQFVVSKVDFVSTLRWAKLATVIVTRCRKFKTLLPDQVLALSFMLFTAIVQTAFYPKPLTPQLEYLCASVAKNFMKFMFKPNGKLVQIDKMERLIQFQDRQWRQYDQRRKKKEKEQLEQKAVVSALDARRERAKRGGRVGNVRTK